MRDKGKTREQLLKELEEARRRIAELGASEAACRREGAALEDKSAFVQSVIDCIAEPISIIGADRRVRLVNRAARQLLGPAEEAASMLCYQCLHRREEPCDLEGAECPMLRVRETGRPVTVVHKHYLPGGEGRFIEIMASPFCERDGAFQGIIETCRDVTERKALEEERERLIAELREALEKIKTLRGLIPVCAWCRKVRDDRGFWEDIENYIRKHSDADFTHGICPECVRKIEEGEIEEEELKNRADAPEPS